MINPNRELMCCVSCGRDTKAKSGLCHRCAGRGKYANHINDHKDRPMISSSVLGGCADGMEDVEGESI